MVALMCDCCCKDKSFLIFDIPFYYNLTTPLSLDVPSYDSQHYGHYNFLINFGGLKQQGNILLNDFYVSRSYGLYYYSFRNDFLGRNRIFFDDFWTNAPSPFDGQTHFLYPNLYFYASNLPFEYLSLIYDHLCSFKPQINSLLDGYVDYLRSLPKYPDMPTEYPGEFFNLIKPRFLDNPRLLYNFVANVRICVRFDEKKLFKSLEILSFEIKDL